MKLKQIFILLAVLAVLLLGVFIKNSQHPAELATQEYMPLDLSFETDKIAKIIISRKKLAAGETGEDRIEMIRGVQGWQVKTLFGARGDKEKIEKLLFDIKNAAGEERGQGSSLFSDFSISDDQAFHVSLADSSDKEILGFALGTKRTGSGAFVRKKGSEKIYLSSTDFLGALGFFGEVEKESPKNDFWVSRDFLFFDASKVDRITTFRFESGLETITALVVKEAGKWKYPVDKYPAQIDPEKVSKFLENMKSWKASQVLDPKAKDYGLAAPKWIMKIGIEGGGETVVTVGGYDEASTSYYVQAAGEPVVYLLSKYFFENFDIDDSKFFKEPLLNELNAQNVESLKVWSGKKTFSVKPVEKNWDSLEKYLKDLTLFRIGKVILDPKEEKKFIPKSGFEIKIKDQAPQAFEFGDLLPDTKEYLARKKGNETTFTVSEAFHKNVFEAMDRLKEPELLKPATSKA